MSSVAFAVSCANSLTSFATTAKPLPACALVSSADAEDTTDDITDRSSPAAVSSAAPICPSSSRVVSAVRSPAASASAMLRRRRTPRAMPLATTRPRPLATTRPRPLATTRPSDTATAMPTTRMTIAVVRWDAYSAWAAAAAVAASVTSESRRVFMSAWAVWTSGRAEVSLAVM
ncbi:MAG: hypothetical protein JWQ37_3720 [Blastococcus sp.]|nr:hypothetical protein [Blastococcus sp.]